MAKGKGKNPGQDGIGDDQATALHESQSAQAGKHPTEGVDKARTSTGNDVTLDSDAGRKIAAPHGGIGSKNIADTRRDAETLDSSGVPGRDGTGARPLKIGGYDVISELGRGGMGVVYKARHQKLKREVALKMILSGQLAGTQILKRFHVEAEAVARLQHPNIVQIFEVGSHDDQPFIALEFVDGKNLSDLVKEKPMLPRDAASVVMTLARAMQYAHTRNVLHRDLKPANVLMAKDGTPKITDFGLAKQLDEIDSAKTSTGAILGTPSYMSPEQAMGIPENIGAATDQYSLGAMMYALITGRPPFLSAKPMDTVSKVLHQEPLPPHKMVEGLPRDLETICLKVLQKNPAQRYASCGDLADDLQRFLNNEPIVARPISRAERTIRWCKRNPTIAIPTGIAFALLIALFAMGGISYGLIAKQRDRAEANFVLAEKNAVRAQDNAAVAVQNEELAKQNEILAKQNQAIAEGREKDAQEQAVALMKNVQFIITDVDSALANEGGKTELRLKIAERQAEVWDQIDKSVRDDAQGEAIPTLMGVRMKLGTLFADLGIIDKASEQFDKLIERGRERVVVKNNSDSARLNLAKIYLMAALMRDRFNRDLENSMELKTNAATVVKDIIDNPKPEEGSPDLYTIYEVYAETLQRQAAAHMSKGELDKSTALIDQALAIRRENINRLPDTEAFKAVTPDKQQAMLAEAALSLDRSEMATAYTGVKTGQGQKALDDFGKIIALRKTAAETNPTLPYLEQEYSRFAGLYGECLMWENSLPAAAEQLEVSVNAAKKFAAADEKNVELQRQYSLALYRRGCVRDLQADSAGASGDFTECTTLRQKIFDATKGEKDETDLLLALGRTGMLEQAEPILARYAAMTTADSELQLKVARSLSSLAASVEGEEREALRARAIKALERAIDEDFSDPYKVRIEPDFHWLAESPEFVELVSKIGNQ